jgi:hypothetical protein
MTKTLQMLFVNEEGRTVTVSLPDPLETLTALQVSAVMDMIVLKNAFVSTGGALVSGSGARVVSRGVETIL